MKAAYQKSYGSAEILLIDDVLPRPTLRKSDLLVKVRYASLNPIDFHMRAGYGRQIMEHKRAAIWPLVLGRDGIGEVIELGAKAGGFNIGDIVVFALGPEDQGSCAQYCRVPRTAAALLPANVEVRDAASLSYVALTSWRALVDVAGIEPGHCSGQRILVHAGAGGVGSFAIQLLKLWGATVITTCSEANMDKVKALGADLAIDYKAERFEEKAGAVDGVLDTVGFEYEERSLSIVNRGGFYASIVTPLIMNITDKGIPSGLLVSAGTFIRQKIRCRGKGIRYGWSLFQPNGEALAYVMQCIGERKIVAHIDTEFPLDSIIEAHQYLEAGLANGKVMICVS
jgi:NADPH:quinone reductase-like Zn-dependent oxidoreductase|tara:strand:+ start:6174 stop:7196 length:1023 start_codon:yes stop_codon:yes gene_type:complete